MVRINARRKVKGTPVSATPAQDDVFKDIRFAAFQASVDRSIQEADLATLTEPCDDVTFAVVIRTDKKGRACALNWVPEFGDGAGIEDMERVAGHVREKVEKAGGTVEVKKIRIPAESLTLFEEA